MVKKDTNTRRHTSLHLRQEIVQCLDDDVTDDISRSRVAEKIFANFTITDVVWVYPNTSSGKRYF